MYRLGYSHGIARQTSMRGNIKRLGLYGEDLSRLVRRSREAAFASIVPPGTDTSLKTLTQHFVLGYFRQVPPGLIFSDRQRTCAILIATS